MQKTTRNGSVCLQTLEDGSWIGVEQRLVDREAVVHAYTQCAARLDGMRPLLGVVLKGCQERSATMPGKRKYRKNALGRVVLSSVKHHSAVIDTLSLIPIYFLIPSLATQSTTLSVFTHVGIPLL